MSVTGARLEIVVARARALDRRGLGGGELRIVRGILDLARSCNAVTEGQAKAIEMLFDKMRSGELAAEQSTRQERAGRKGWRGGMVSGQRTREAANRAIKF